MIKNRRTPEGQLTEFGVVLCLLATALVPTYSKIYNTFLLATELVPLRHYHHNSTEQVPSLTV